MSLPTNAPARGQPHHCFAFPSWRFQGRRPATRTIIAICVIIALVTAGVVAAAVATRSNSSRGATLKRPPGEGNNATTSISANTTGSLTLTSSANSKKSDARSSSNSRSGKKNTSSKPASSKSSSHSSRRDSTTFSTVGRTVATLTVVSTVTPDADVPSETLTLEVTTSLPIFRPPIATPWLEGGPSTSLLPHLTAGPSESLPNLTIRFPQSSKPTDRLDRPGERGHRKNG